MSNVGRVRVATRGSPLAWHQTDLVAGMLDRARPGLSVERVVVRTEGDRRSDVAIDRIAGTGAFVKSVQAAVLEGRADIAVHSAKDLPPVTPRGLVLAAVPVRADPRDALVGRTLDGLAAGATVASGSPRRRAQLANVRPDLTFVALRGNIGTRVAQAGQGQVDAVVVAVAALVRLGWEDRIAQVLAPSLMLPQVGQGALAVECRDGDDLCLDLLAAVDDRVAHRAVTAERAFLAALGGGCAVPVAAWAEPGAGAPGDDRLRLRGMLASGDGRVLIQAEVSGEDPEVLGRGLARHLVEDCGGSMIEGW